MTTRQEKREQNRLFFEERRKRKEQEELFESLLNNLDPKSIKTILKKHGMVIDKPAEKNPIRDLLIAKGKPPCPHCGSISIYSHGSDAYGFPRYKCADCKHTFSIKTGSLVAGSSWNYDMWVTFVQLTIQEQSLRQIQHVFKDDFNVFITQETLLKYRHKLLRAIAINWEMPILSGVIQTDETFYRENQKASRHLVSVIPDLIPERLPRTPGHHVPSEYGIMGREFSCVVVGIDSAKHVVAIFTGLGRATATPFKDYFEEYLGRITFFCSDGFTVYADYCNTNNIPHYVQQSKWKSYIKEYQKAFQEKTKYKPSEAEVRKKLYRSRTIDYIDNYGSLSYEQFEALKAEKGLSLDSVDGVHKQMKDYINRNLTGVATVYLPLYLNLFCFRHNWSVDHDKALPTSKKDAEIIFAKLLGLKVDLSKTEERKSITEIPQVTTKYVKHLAEVTEELRRKAENRGLTIDDGDVLIKFDKRKYFETSQITELRRIGREKQIKGYSHMSKSELVNRICSLPDKDEIFMRLIQADSSHVQYLDDVKGIIDAAAEVYGKKKK